MNQVIKFSDKFSSFEEQWAPKIIAQMNDNDFKIAKIEGEFIWHDHPETDEVFIVIKGNLEMDFRDRTVELGPGEMIVVKAGTEHRPRAKSECEILMIEKSGTINTGDVSGAEIQPTSGEWI